MPERLSAEIPKAEKLKMWLNAHEIELALFDLDDTFTDTHQVFKNHVQKFFAHVFQKLSLLDQQRFLGEFDELEKQKFYLHAVNPVGYQFIIRIR